MSIPLDLQSTLAAAPEILGGTVRFKGTRVPVQALFDTILAGENLDYFLDDFPDVTKTQALAVLNWESNETRKVFGLELVDNCVGRRFIRHIAADEVVHARQIGWHKLGNGDLIQIRTCRISRN